MLRATTESRPHTSADIQRARELHEGGWSYPDIHRILAKDGVIVHRNTIRIWCNDKLRQKHRENDLQVKLRKNAERNGGRFLDADRLSMEFRMARMSALRAEGLSPAAIATVLNFDGLGGGLTRFEVEDALRRGRPPKRWQEAA